MYTTNSFNILVLILAIWTIPWKGYALWLAAKRNQKIWFVVILILNTIRDFGNFLYFQNCEKKLDGSERRLANILVINEIN